MNNTDPACLSMMLLYVMYLCFTWQYNSYGKFTYPLGKYKGGDIWKKINFNAKNSFNAILNTFVYLVTIVPVLLKKLEYWGTS